jgi:hypothetical protein
MVFKIVFHTELADPTIPTGYSLWKPVLEYPVKNYLKLLCNPDVYCRVHNNPPTVRPERD